MNEDNLLGYDDGSASKVKYGIASYMVFGKV